MTARRPSKPWRLVVSSPDARSAGLNAQRLLPGTPRTEKQTTTADRIIVQKWDDGRWDEWLLWVRTDSTWHAE